MTTRLLVLPVVFIALLVSGCADAVDSAPAEETPPKPKTTAELLVGTWEWVKTDGDNVRVAMTARATFTADGRLCFRTTDPWVGNEIRAAGTYRLVGQTILYTTEPTPSTSGAIGELGIESVSETELTLAKPRTKNGTRHPWKYKRVEPEQMDLDGCAAPGGRPKAVEQPQAEPQRPKTTAELLVGNWEWIATDDNPISGIVKKWSTFTADGRFTFRSTDRRTGNQVTSGTYRLEGRTIKYACPPEGADPGRTWEQNIESVSETELILAWPPEKDGTRYRSRYKRIEQK